MLGMTVFQEALEALQARWLVLYLEDPLEGRADGAAVGVRCLEKRTTRRAVKTVKVTWEEAKGPESMVTFPDEWNGS